MTDARDEIQDFYNDWLLNPYSEEDEPPPRFRYFQKQRGPCFCWTTERVEGFYGSFVLLPVGPGSRSGKAEEWRMDEASISSHQLRKDAKSRALRLFTEWKTKT